MLFSTLINKGMTKESSLTRIPSNTSLLQPTKFTLEFPHMPFLRYFLQKFPLPSMSTSAPRQVANGFSDIKRHGDKLEWEDLVVTALIDEDMRVWEETKDWLHSLTTPNRFEEYVRFRDPSGKPYHDAVLTVNTNANLQNIRFKFTNLHPISLGSVLFDTTSNADNILVADIVFAYDQYYLERVN
jgi:hypothetical protein